MLHAQAGLSSDGETTPGVRIPYGSEPDPVSHVQALLPHHQYYLSGVSEILTLDETVRANPRFPLMRLGVVGWIQSADAVATADARGFGAGRVRPADRFSGRANAVIGAVSAADVYFRRPPQTNDRIEYASLYSPYWQVRLAPVPPAWRAAAIGYFH